MASPPNDSNEAVSRNIRRFLGDVMFRLTASEENSLRSQFATSRSRHGGPSVARVLHSLQMARQVTQRQLRNESGKIMRALDRGETFVVTRNGVPVGELQPLKRQFVPAETAVAAFRRAPSIAPKRFRRDVDRYLNQDARPRA